MESSKALNVLGQMGGMSVNQAKRYLEKCTPDEVADLESCEDGKEFSEFVNIIADRQNQKAE